MWFKHRAWIPVAWILAIGNLGGALFALRSLSGPVHVAAHLVLAAAFALGARHLAVRRRPEALNDQLQQVLDMNEQLQLTVDSLEGRLRELEERVDFAERLLATQRDADRLRVPPS